MAVITLGTDFHQWAETTAEAIRDKRFGDVDWEQVAEEIDSLGKSEASELGSRLSQLMYHLLKVEHQPERHSKSWDRTIRDQKAAIQAVLQKQPSLKPRLADPEFWQDAYRDVTTLASNDDLPDNVVEQFPEDCPYSLDVLK